MKKVLMLTCSVFLLLGSFFIYHSTKASSPVIDQFNTVTSSASGYNVMGRGPLCQKFKPTRSIFANYVDITVKNGNGMNADLELRANSENRPGSVLRPFNGRMSTESPNWQRVTNIDGLETTLTVGNYYWLCLTTANSNLEWTYRNPSMYNYGYAMLYFDVPGETALVDTDFGFATYSSDPEEEEQPSNNNTNSSNSNTNSVTNTNTNSVTLPAGQSVGTGSAPATTTSSAIKTASALTALYSDGAANLAWTKSATTDIDGYKIFRSEAEKTGFKEIGKTVKTTVEYVDNKDLTVGKTYYYFVRAYKGTAESASTPIVSLLIPEATVTTNTNTNSTVPLSTTILDDTDYRTLQINWILGGVIGILLVLLVAYEREQKRKGGFPGAKHFRLVK